MSKVRQTDLHSSDIRFSVGTNTLRNFFHVKIHRMVAQSGIYILSHYLN